MGNERLWIRTHGDVERHLRRQGRLPNPSGSPNSSSELSFSTAFFASVLLAVVAVLVSGFFASCSSLPVKQPAQAWVEGERSIHDSLAKRMRLYLAADESREVAGEMPVLPMLERSMVEELLVDWDFMIRSHEQLVPASAQ